MTGADTDPMQCHCFGVRTAMPHRQCIRFQLLLQPDRGARLPGTTTGHKQEGKVEGGRPFLALDFFAAAERWNITACSPNGQLGRASQPSPYSVRLRSAAAVIGGGYVPLHGCSPACRQCRCLEKFKETKITVICDSSEPAIPMAASVPIFLGLFTHGKYA